MLKSRNQDFIFTKKTGERRNSRYGQGGYQKGNIGDGHVFSQTAHVF